MRNSVAESVASRRSSQVPPGVTVSTRHASNQLFHIYLGGVSSPAAPINFFGETRLLERNIAIFRDRYSAFYQRGVSSELPSFEALLQWQLEFRRSCAHVRRFFCVGTCSGGYAALLFGHLLRAETVWAFEPLTRPDDWLDDAAIPPERADLSVLLARWNGRTTYNIYRSTEEVKNRENLGRLASCPGVNSRPVPARPGSVLKHLIDQGGLETLFPPPS